MSKVIIMDCVEYICPILKQDQCWGRTFRGWGRFVMAGMKVPSVNLIGPKAPETAAITTRSLCGLIQILKGLMQRVDWDSLAAP